MKQFKRSQNKPKNIIINGEEYPAIFTLGAMADIEEKTGIPYAKLFNRMAEGEGTIKEQAALVWACLQAGGTKVEFDDLVNSLDINQFADVLTQIMNIIGEQTPEAGEQLKNV